MPVFVGAGEQGAVVHGADGVQEDIDRTCALGRRCDRGAIAGIEPRHVGDALTFERRETFLVDIGCKDSGTLARKGDCRGAADAGRSGGDEGAFALEAVWHVFSRDLSVSYAGLTRVSIALEV